MTVLRRAEMTMFTIPGHADHVSSHRIRRYRARRPDECESTAPRLQRRLRREGARPRIAVRFETESRQSARLVEAAERATASHRHGLRRRQRAVPRLALSLVGLRHPHRDIRRALPDTEDARRGNDRAGKVHAEARRARAAGRLDIESEERAASDVQRLLDRWR